MKYKLIIMALILLMSSFALTASAVPAGPKNFVISINEKITPLLTDTKKNKKKIVKMVNQLIDFPSLCKASLGKHWAERTEAEQKDFTETLKSLIEQNVIKRLKDTKEHKISYQSETVTGDSATVITIVADGDGPRATKVEIAYKMKKKKNGKWIVTDIVTDGMSLVSNYQSSFHKIITKDGWAKLMEKMKKKLE